MQHTSDILIQNCQQRKCTKTFQTAKKTIKNTAMLLNLKMLVFHDLHKTSVKFASVTKTTSKILITTLINVQNAWPKPKNKLRYTEARIEYQKPITEKVVCFTADMQRVYVLPKLITKEHLFVSRLVTFNKTFASKTPGKPDYYIKCFNHWLCNFTCMRF